MEVNYNYNNGTILKFLRKVLNEINKEYVDSGMRTAYIMKHYVEKYKIYGDDHEKGPKLALLCMMKDIGIFYMNGEVPDDDPALAAASSYAFLHYCSPLGTAARPLLFYKAKYIETDMNDSTAEAYKIGLLMTLINQVILYIYEQYSVEEIEEALREGKKQGLYEPDQVKKVIKLLKDEPGILEKLNSESQLYVYETQKYISGANFSDMELEGFIDTTSYAFEFHNHETLAHTITTASIAYDLALKCRLTQETAEIIKLAARVHDVGKIRVPREILCYPGRLEGEMLEEMQRHVVYTREIIEGSFSYKIVDVASNHHEKLDGTGYPRGLKDIDLSSGDKVIAIADICSALYCRRSYKAAFDDEKIQEILLSDAKNGKLDLRIVNHLIENYDEIMAHAKEAESKVLDKYNAMKEEYESLSEGAVLKEFFDMPKTEEYEEEPVEEETEETEEISEESEEVMTAEDYLNDKPVLEEEYEDSSNEEAREESEYEETSEEEISSDEYVVPDSMLDKDDVYHEEYEDGIKPEEAPEESIEDDEFLEFINSVPDAEESKSEDETSEETTEENTAMEESIDELEEPIDEAEDEENDPLSDAINDAAKVSEDDEFLQFINSVPDSNEALDPLDESEEESLEEPIDEESVDEEIPEEKPQEDASDVSLEDSLETTEDDEFLKFINDMDEKE